MKQTVLTVVCFALILAACAPRPSVIAAGVSGTLTALAPTASLPVDRPTSTQVPTLSPPTQASSPAPTETATGEAIVSFTQTPASEPTPLLTLAPPGGQVDTPTPETYVLREMIFQDTFDAPGAWAVGETEDSNVSVSGGVMSFTQKTPGSFSFRIIGKQGQDFHVEVMTALADRCGSGDRYGLML